MGELMRIHATNALPPAEKTSVTQHVKLTLTDDCRIERFTSEVHKRERESS